VTSPSSSVARTRHCAKTSPQPSPLRCRARASAIRRSWQVRDRLRRLDHRGRASVPAVVQGQPQAYSEKTGKPDSRGAYGLMGQEMIGWPTHLQHTRRKNVWFVGILNEALDDFNRRVLAADRRLQDRARAARDRRRGRDPG
jgi:hypothetical protein